MAVALRNVSATPGNPSLTASKPVGTADGDALVAQCMAFTGTTITGPAGWTVEDNAAWKSGNFEHSTWSKVAASEGASWTWGGPPTGQSVTCVAAFSGAHATTPVNANNQTSGASGTATTPSITPSVNGCMIVALFACDGGTFSTPAGYASLWNLDGGDVRGFYLIQATAAAVSVASTVTGGVTNNWVAAILAIAPPAGAAQDTPELRAGRNQLRQLLAQ